MATNALYAPPSITVSANGPQTLLTTGSGARVVCVVGTSSQGPDYPVLCDYGRALALYGSPTAIQSLGHTLPLGLYYINGQRQPTGNTSLLFLCIRVGVTRAALTIKDQSATPLTAFILQGIGVYAGSAGNSLQVVVATTGAVINSIAINDNSSGTSVQRQFYPSTTYNLTSNSSIAAAINGANPLTNPGSIVQVTTVSAAALVPAALSTANSLTGGLDGLGTASTDISIDAGLAASLWTHADFLWMGFDAAAIQGKVATHLNAAAGGGTNEFRKAILGPKYGTTFATMTSAYNSFNSARIVCIGHDGAYGVNPVSGTSTILDGFYLAAAYCGLKAIGPVEETGTGMAISGFSTLAIPSDKASILQSSDLNNLAGSGFLVFEQRPNGALFVRDAVTTAPQITNNQVNPFSQFNIQDIDDAVSNALVAAVSPFKGRPSASLSAQISQLQNACTVALAALGSTINGINSVIVSVDPNTLVPTIAVSYITRYPYLQISIQTSYSFL